MPAPPSKNSISGSGSTPSNAQARAGFGALWETLFGTGGLLGSSGNAVDARNALGIGSTLNFRNLLVNGNFSLNQRGYATGTATTVANQYTLDRWRVVTSGQNVAFGAASPDRTVTAPAGGIEQVVEGANMAGGIYSLSWTGTATATVNGTAIANGGQTAALTAGANATIRFSSGTVGLAQFELGQVTPTERRPIAIELLMAQRYFQIVTANWRGQLQQASGALDSNVQWSPMRVSPTSTPVSATGFATSNIVSDNLIGTSPTGARWELVVGLANTDAYVLNRNFYLSAEL